MSGISSVRFTTSSTNLEFNIGGNSSDAPSRCRSMHVSNTEISFDYPWDNDFAPTMNVYTSNGGFVRIDSGSNMLHGLLKLHGGNAAITDLEILHSTYGTLFSHAVWSGITWDAGTKLRLVGSKLGGDYFHGDSSVNIFIDSCNIETNGFHLGDHSTATLLNSTVTNNGNNVGMTFFIGKNSTFVSANDTVSSYSAIQFTTSGSQLNGNVYINPGYSSVVDFLQEDPSNPLPNIINGNLSAGELNSSMGISGELKISGNLTGFPDDAFNNPTKVLVNGQYAFAMAGITNYEGTTQINNCMNNFCHFKLEFFGNTDSRITWNTGFPVDTLIINKTGCAKVTFAQSLYVSGATRIESGQLALDPNDSLFYKFVCAGNLDIAQGGGLFLRRDSAGVVANIAVEGTLVDHNSVADSSCAGLSNPYIGIISRAQPPRITLLYKNDMGWDNPLSWIQINTPIGQTPIQRVPTENDDVVISYSMSGISSVSFETDSTKPEFNIGGHSSDAPSRCRSLHVSNTAISFDNPSLINTDAAINVYTSNGGFVIIDSGSNMLHGLFQLHGGNAAITDLEILHSTYGGLFSHFQWTGITWDAEARLRLVGSKLGGDYFHGDSSVNIFVDSCNIETTSFHLGDNSTATLLNSTVTNNGTNVSMTFFIGKNSTFVSAKDTVHSFGPLNFTTSGSQLNGNVDVGYPVPAELDFLQEDPSNPLPNIINGNLSAGELSNSMGISGDLKISGNISGYSDDAFNNPTPVLVNSKEVFAIGGINNYKGTTQINNCINDFCHFKLELFGNTDSRISWNTGFPVDTLIINKSNCAKVSIDSSLYVSGATRIESGQLVLSPNDNYHYKFISTGNVDIAQGGGLFLRRDSAGVVANMAIEGTLVDHNSVADSACTGLSNPYNGIITFYKPSSSDSLFDFNGSYQNKTVTLSWSTEGEINTKYFTIEKSFDQVTFLPLGNITATGNAGKNYYQFTDQGSLKAINYYRLKIINADSLFTYSKTIAINAPVSNEIVIYPNPAKDKLFIRLADISGETQIIISDARGVIINKLQMKAGIMESSVNILDLQPGVYSISFLSGNAKTTKQFVKL